MEISELRLAFADSLGDEFRVSYRPYYQTSGRPVTNTFTLVDPDTRGAYLKTEYEKVVFIPYARMEEVFKIK